MQEASHVGRQCESCEAFGAVAIDDEHLVAIGWSERDKCREVHDAVDIAQAFGERRFVLQSCFDPFVRDVGKL